jgi:surface antigen
MSIRTGLARLTRRRAAAAVLVASTTCFQLPAHAVGWVAALKNTAAEDFDAEDLKMFLAAAEQTLDADRPGVESTWRNPATGAAGTFRELSRSRDAQGMDCRRVRFVVSTRKTREQAATWVACRDADGRWRLVAAR